MGVILITTREMKLSGYFELMANDGGGLMRNICGEVFETVSLFAFGFCGKFMVAESFSSRYGYD